MGLQDNLDELTRVVQTMLDDCVCVAKADERGYTPLSEDYDLGRTGWRALRQAISLCLDDPQVQGVAGRREVQTILQLNLIRGLSDATPAEEIAVKSAEDLTSGAEPCVVLYPVENLRLDCEPLSIGCVTLLPQTHERVAQRRSAVADTFSLRGWEACFESWGPANEFGALGEAWRSEGLAYAEVEVQAVRGSEEVAAEPHAEEALHYLRCCLCTQGGWSWSEFGLPWTYVPELSRSARFRLDGQPIGIRTGGRLAPIEVDCGMVEEMREKWSLDAVSAALEAPIWQRRALSSDSMLARLTAAIHWAGRAATEQASAYSAANYATAIDALAVHRYARPKGTEFVKRALWFVEQWCAAQDLTVDDILWGPVGASASDLEQWLTDFYGEVRCGVVHDGDVLISQKWLETLSFWPTLALMAIAVVADNIHEWPTFDAFDAAYGGGT